MSRKWLVGWIVSGAIVLAALLVTALGDPVELMTPRAGLTAPPIVTHPPTFTTDTVSTSLPDTGGIAPPLGASSAVIGLVVEALGVAVVLLLLVAVLAVIRSVWRTPRLVSRPAADFVTPEVPDELIESAEARMTLLEGGEPRNAIVAAWLSLETSAEATGLARDPAETSTEYTTRVLHTWDVDPRSIGDLAALYREARFSRHPLGEEHRRRAMRDLTSLHDDLRRVAGQQGRPGLGATRAAGSGA